MIGMLLAYSLASATLSIDGVEREPLADFREKFPAPANSAEARATWEGIDAAFRRDAADGARAQVAIHHSGGTTRGEDEYRLEPTPALRELRGDSETLAVGNRACWREAAGAWECSATEVEHGLPTIDWDAVLDAEITHIDCEGKRCVRLRLNSATFTDYVAGDAPAQRLYAVPILENTRAHEVVAQIGRDTLRSFRVVERRSGKLSTLTTWLYDMDAKVESITLPQ